MGTAGCAIDSARWVIFKRRSATQGVAGADPWVETHGYIRVSLRDGDPAAYHVSDDGVLSSVHCNPWSSAMVLGGAVFVRNRVAVR